MRILVEHPNFCPYQDLITGGTEMFVHRVRDALRLQGHDVTVFGSKDSEECLRSSAYSQEEAHRRGQLLKSGLWYSELGEAAKDFDRVILNTTLSSPLLLDPKRSHWYHKVIYFNHNGSAYFTKDRPGRQMQSVVRYLRSCGGTSLYFAESNRSKLAAVWEKEKNVWWASKVLPGFARIKDMSFLELDLFDRIFDQAVEPEHTHRVLEPQGYLIAAGRNTPDKKLNYAQKTADKMGRKIFVFTGTDHRHVMDVLAGADCLLLPSIGETFSIIGFEALYHGVPVSYEERPPSMDRYPELERKWKDVVPTDVKTREKARKELSAKYSLRHFSERLEQVLTKEKL